ncbi:MAG: PAS domain S-box protein [Anaerolineae bacterium]|nr:PAS domain S-box protein [Anaerolineae bacterium]
MTPSAVTPPLNVAGRGRIAILPEFNALLNLLPEACMLVERPSGVVIQVNSALLKLTAFSSDELCGNPLINFIPDETISRLMPGEESQVLLNRRNRSPIAVVVQTSYLDVEGQWSLLSVVPAQRHQQSVLQKQETMFQVLLDLARLTEPPDLEQCFEKALLLAQSLLGTQLVCIYQADTQTPQLTKIASIEPVAVFPEVIPSTDFIRLARLSVWAPGKRVLTEIHRAGRIENLAYVASVPLGQEGALMGMLVAGAREDHPDEQQIRFLEILGAHISGAILHYILVGNLGDRIREQESLLAVGSDIMENAQEGIVVLDEGFRIAQINAAAEVMLGYADTEVRGQPVDNILIGADALATALENALHGIATHDLGNVHLHRRNGQSFPAHIQVIPAQRDQGLLALLVFVRDVTEYEQIRVRTQQLEHRALLGEFTAVFAHEVRNPINNISTGLQLLSSRLAHDDPNQELIGRMRDDCIRLHHLMESVLSFSRPGETKFEPIVMDIFLQRILDRWRPRLAKVNVEPYFQAEENLPRILGDPRTLEQVFTNLISNSIDAMSVSGGMLAIRVSRNNEVSNNPQVQITVSDNGPGIPDDIRERVFEPFVTNKPRGTGLGLAITKSIVTAHRGSISLNTFPGGTVFTINLPAYTNGE